MAGRFGLAAAGGTQETKMSRRAGQVVLGLGPHQASLELRRGSQGAAEGRLGLGAQGDAACRRVGLARRRGWRWLSPCVPAGWREVAIERGRRTILGAESLRGWLRPARGWAVAGHGWWGPARPRLPAAGTFLSPHPATRPQGQGASRSLARVRAHSPGDRPPPHPGELIAGAARPAISSGNLLPSAGRF